MAVSSWRGFFLAKCSSSKSRKILRSACGWIWLSAPVPLAEQRNVAESGLAKNRFALLNVGLRERLALRGNRHVAFSTRRKPTARRVNAGQQVVDFQTQFVRKAMRGQRGPVVGRFPAGRPGPGAWEAS